MISDNNNFFNTITAHPNPASNIIIINYDNNLARLTKVTIYDIQGKALKEQIKNQTIDISDLPAGTYIIKLTFDNQFKTYKLFQKQ